LPRAAAAVLARDRAGALSPQLADAEKIRAALQPGAAIVIIGGGFIGLEIAASAKKLGAEVTVLEAAPRLLSRGTPALVSDFAWRLHRGNGVRFELAARIECVAVTGSRVEVTTQRASYAGDLVIAGIGAEPNVELAAAAGLAIQDGIRVDEFGRTSDEAIFAAGDVTRHLNPLLDRAIRVESWQVALNQAAAVAKAMLGATEPYAELPWLWTDQYDGNIQLLGIFDEWQELIVRGDPASASFTLLGLAPDGRLAAAVTVIAAATWRCSAASPRRARACRATASPIRPRSSRSCSRRRARRERDTIWWVGGEGSVKNRRTAVALLPHAIPCGSSRHRLWSYFGRAFDHPPLMNRRKTGCVPGAAQTRSVPADNENCPHRPCSGRPPPFTVSKNDRRRETSQPNI